MSEWLDPYELPEQDEQRRLHIERYQFAKDNIKGNVVANAACSCNYGYEFLKTPGRLVIGFDRNPVAIDLARRIYSDMLIEKDIQDEAFDGFSSLVCLETFEHLEKPWEFLKSLSTTVKEVVLSTPVCPTKHFNEWHLHDFTVEDVKFGLEDNGWNIQQWFFQNEQNLPHPTYLVLYATR